MCEVPIVGWLQIIVVIALSELWRYENVPASAAWLRVATEKFSGRKMEMRLRMQVISKYSQGVQPGDLGWNPTAPVSSPRPKWPAAQRIASLLASEQAEPEPEQSTEKTEVWAHLHCSISAGGALHHSALLNVGE